MSHEGQSQQDLEKAVDAIEEKVLGRATGGGEPGPPGTDEAPETGAEDQDGPAPAFDLDLDPEDQGSADAGASNPD